MKHRKALILILVAIVCLAVATLAGCSCKGCGKNKNHEHDFGELVVGIAKTCETDGTLSYYECKTCKEKYDETKTIRLTDITVKKGHEIASVKEYVAPTCKKEGNYAYSYCSACNKYLDADGNELTSLIIPKIDHDFDGGHYERKEPTCTENGNIEYYKCGLCNGYYTKDEHGFNETTKENVVLEKTNHSAKTYIEEVPSSCTGDGTEGVKGHFHCDTCGKDLDMKGNVVSGDDLKIAPAHKLSYVKKTDNTCEEDGVKEHYHCSVCDRNYSDEKGTTLSGDVNLPKTGHSCFNADGTPNTALMIARKEATATENGYIAHYACDNCGKLFDESGAETANVILLFGHNLEYKERVPADCGKGVTGLLAHYECTDEGCDLYFDADGRTVSYDSLVISADHVFGDLIEKQKTDCLHEEVIKEHYKCEACGLLTDENGNELNHYEAYGYYGDHSFTTGVYVDEEYHTAFCSVCGYNGGRYFHAGVNHYHVNAFGEKVKTTECTACGYVGQEKTYFSPDEVEIMPVCVGKDDLQYITAIFHRDDRNQSYYTYLSDVIGKDAVKELEEFMKEFAGDKTKKVAQKEVVVTYEDFSESIKISFYKDGYELDEVYADEDKYDVTSLGSLNEVRYVRYTLKGEQNVYSVKISDDDNARFDAVKRELIENGGEKAFTYSVTDNDGYVFEITVTLCAETPVSVMQFAVESDVIAGNRARIIRLVYSDYSHTEVDTELYCDEYYFVDFDVAGYYNAVCVYNGIYITYEVTVHDGNDIENILLSNNNIELGEELYLIAEYYDGHKEIVVVTEDMVKSDNLDMKKAGIYNDVIIVYGGKEYYAWRINVKDNDDDAPSSIYAEESKVLWETDKDGNIIENLSGLEIRVYRKNGESYFVDVTHAMISYDKSLAKEALKNGESFSVTVNYLGLTCEFEVSALTDETEIMYAGASLYFENKIFGEKYLAVGTTDYKKYYVKITADMIYNAKETGEGTGEYVKTTPFDLASAERGIYDVIIVYGGREFAETAYVYSSSDVKSIFSVGADDYYVAGSKESVIKTIKQSLTPFYATYIDFGTDRDGLEDEDVKGTSLNVMVPDDVDFSKPGKIKLVITYKNVATAIETELIASPSGGKVYYLVDGDDVTKITVFNEGYVFAYGEYGKCFKDDANGVFGIKRNYGLFYQEAFYKTTETENILEPFKASDGNATLVKTLNYSDDSDNYEYGFYNLNGKIYADKFSIRNGTRSYRETCYAEFSSDGKTVVLNGEEKYTVDGDAMRFAMEGKTVYKFVYEEDEGVYNEFYFNDDGNVYSVVVEENEDGTVTETVLGGIAKWAKQGNEVKLMLGNMEIIRFEVVTVDGEETLAIVFNLID